MAKIPVQEVLNLEMEAVKRSERVIDTTVNAQLSQLLNNDAYLNAQLQAHDSNPDAHGGIVTSSALDTKLAGFKAALENVTPQIKLYPLVIPIAGWQTADDGGYFIDINNDNIQEVHHVAVTFSLDSLDIAADCGLSPFFSVLDGLLRFYAASVPTADLYGDYMLIAESGAFMDGGPGGISDTALAPYIPSSAEIDALLSSLH